LIRAHFVENNELSAPPLSLLLMPLMLTSCRYATAAYAAAAEMPHVEIFDYADYSLHTLIAAALSPRCSPLDICR